VQKEKGGKKPGKEAHLGKVPSESKKRGCFSKGGSTFAQPYGVPVGGQKNKKKN